MPLIPGWRTGRPESVRKYQEYRKVGRDLSDKILDTVPEDALIRSGKLLGIVRGKTFVFESESESNAQFDFLLFEQQVDGKTAAEQYRDTPGGKNELEREILDAFASSYTSLFRVEAVSKTECSLTLQDLLFPGRTVTITDIGFSQTATPGLLMFIRAVPLRDFSMTSGMSFVFPASQEEFLLNEYPKLARKIPSPRESARRFIAFFRLNRRYGQEVLFR